MSPELIIFTDQLTGEERRIMATNYTTGQSLAETLSEARPGEVFRLRLGRDHAFVYNRGEIVLEGTFAYIESELQLVLPQPPIPQKESTHG